MHDNRVVMTCPCAEKGGQPELRHCCSVKNRAVQAVPFLFRYACLLLSAYKVTRFNQLKAVARAYFDWLVGESLRKEVRGGQFGLP